MVEKQISEVNRDKSKEGFQHLSQAFYEASKVSFSLVFFPIVLVLIGVWIDKKLGSTPLFIIVGIISGVLIGIYKATEVKKRFYSKTGERKNG